MKSRQKKAERPLLVYLNPSQVTSAYWLFAECKFGNYPEHTERGGKWLIFVPVALIDEVWAKIKFATEEGKLGKTAKVSTARPNPNSPSPDKSVICVYTYDSTDQEDVWRVRQVLRDLDVTWKIPYKTDEDTHCGRYKNRGDKRISKYYG